MRISAHSTMSIFRQLDDAVTQRFHSTLRARKAHSTGIIHVALRHCIGFHHSHPCARLKSRKILRCRFRIGFRNRFCDSIHPRVIACTGSEVGHLSFQVLERHARETSRFRMTLSRHQVTRSARTHFSPFSGDHSGERPVIVGEPIGWMAEVLNLSECILPFAPGDALRFRAF